MATNLDPARLAKLAEQLGLWKAGQMCRAERFPAIVQPYKRTVIVCHKCGGDIVFKPTDAVEPTLTVATVHDIPPPNLLSDTGFSSMVGAWLKQGTLYMEVKRGCYQVELWQLGIRGYAENPDKAVALALALGDFFDKGGTR